MPAVFTRLCTDIKREDGAKADDAENGKDATGSSENGTRQQTTKTRGQKPHRERKCAENYDK